ncbi:MAG: class I SAM-dependent methyltransferase, partial [Armatimonadetes bacterium]|nr:class I SAM-dependent methyltransferase [Armatimonadota bacterium]
EEEYFACPLAYGGQYDRANPPRKLASYLREVRAAKPAGWLLDVGCAFGRFLDVARAHYECEGLDVSRYALERARRLLPEVPLYHTAIQDFGTDKRYEVVTCFDVLEHIPELDLALGRLRDLLAPGGVLAAVIPVYDSPMGWAVGLVDRDPTHLHRWSRRDWVKRLEAAGFTVRTLKGILRVPLPGYFLHGISPLWSRWSAAIFVVCATAEEERA